YAGDSLSERRVFVWRAGLTPYSREIIVYNGLGARAYRVVYAEGMASTPAQTDRYAYDSAGRQISLSGRDEISGDPLYHLAFEYEAAPLAKTAASIPFP